jgi:hypothetical protein
MNGKPFLGADHRLVDVSPEEIRTKNERKVMKYNEKWRRILERFAATQKKINTKITKKKVRLRHKEGTMTQTAYNKK